MLTLTRTPQAHRQPLAPPRNRILAGFGYDFCNSLMPFHVADAIKALQNTGLMAKATHARWYEAKQAVSFYGEPRLPRLVASLHLLVPHV